MSKAYEVITDRILAIIDKGVIPWQCPWSRLSQSSQKNGVSGKDYRGCNQFLLSMVACNEGLASPNWFTFKQAIDLGACVRKGEKGLPVVYFGTFDTDTDKTSGTKLDDKKTVAFLRYSTVFNASQIDGIDPKYTPEPPEMRSSFERIKSCEEIVDGFDGKPDIEIKGDRAFYRPNSDLVVMPLQAAFKTDEDYYATLFHELGHSTGHGKRLARDGVVDPTKFGSHEYGHEELVAEFTAAFLCCRAGIDSPTIERSASYLEGWRKAIKADSKLVVSAAAQAQKAADWIVGNRVAVA